MNHKKYGEVVILVRVSPNGMAEHQFISDYEQIKKKLKVKRAAVQLYSLFGWKTPTGIPYNQYELDFKSEKDLNEALNWLDAYFYKMTISNDFDNEPMLPEVLFVRKRIT